MMVRSEASVATPLARRYLGQLCKHFEHRLAVTYSGDAGRIDFSAGSCILHAADAALVMVAEAADAAGLAQVQDVTARHLVRFAFREPPAIVWTPVSA